MNPLHPKTTALDGNQPILLNGREDLWLIAKGSVDLFAVALQAGQPAGVREPICRLQAGQVLVGLGDSGEAAGMGLLAVGLPQTELAHLAASATDRATLAADAERLTELTAWIDDWLIMLNVVLRQSSAGDALFQADDMEDHEGVVWLGDSDAAAWIPVLVWMPMQQVRSRTVVLPLNLQAWIAAESEGDLLNQDTTTVIRNGHLDTALSAYHRALLEQFQEQRSQRQTLEQQRLQDKQAAEAQMFGDALGGLTHIMDAQTAYLPFTDWTGIAAVDACLLVMEASGIRSPLRNGEKITADSHRIESLVKRSRAATRHVSLSGERWWQEDAGPLLASRRDGSPVALLPRGGNGYWLVDPLDKSTVPLDGDNAAGLNDDALMFFRTFPNEAIGVMAALRLGMVGAGSDVRRLCAVGVLGGLLALFVPFGTGLLIDSVIPNARNSELVQLVLLLLTATLGISAFELTRAIAMLRIMEGRIGNALQMAVIHRLLYLPTVFFRRYSAGDLANRALGVGLIFRQFNSTTQAAVLSWFFGLSSLVCLFFINRILAVLAIVLALLIILIIVNLNRRRLKFERRKYLLQGNLASRVFQLLNGIAKLHGSGAEKRAFALWAKDFAKQKALDYKARRISNVIAVIESGYPVLASMLMFGITAFYVPTLSTGDFVFFNTAFTQFLTSTIAMFTALTTLIPVIPLYERAQPILETLPEISEAHKFPGSLSGAIDISHVTFRYSADGPVILNDLSINIKPGEFIAFVGPSGSGKSTVYRLLLGFERPESGAIYFDGQDLGGLDIGAVRRQLGVVLQNGKLMSGDIFTNIVGSAQLSLDDAWEAARIAGLEEDIKALPMGMHTVIAEGAGTFSGGQKQRLMIARAVVNKPRILLFDEATSALDNRTQAIVSQSIEHLNATRIVIAHRLSTISKADRIFVIEAGQVTETGKYDELMAKNGVFALLAKRQLL
jgi:ATP-binding cassette subfamily C protein